MWLLGAGSGGAALGLSGTGCGTLSKREDAVSQLSSGQVLGPIDVDLYPLFGISESKQGFGQVASVSPSLL